MNRYLIRFFLIATLLCGFLGSANGVMAHGAVCSGEKDEEQVGQYDGWVKQVAEEPQSPVEASLRSIPSSHRVASSRPVRLLPTHGGRPGHHFGQWTADGLLKPCKYFALQLRSNIVRQCAVVGLSRLYYVIALRRLLC